MADRIKKRLSHLLEYAALRTAQFFLRIIPRHFALRVGDVFGTILYATGARRDVIRKNMEYVNIRPQGEIVPLIKRFFRTMGRYAVDFLRGSSSLVTPHTIEGDDILRASISAGKGTILLMGHFGNWEAVLDIIGKTIPDFRVVAKPMHNSYVDKWLERKRKVGGAGTIYMDQAMRKLIRLLQGGGTVAVLIDQHPGSQGTLIPFLGRETATVRTVAWLVEKTGCSVVSLYGILQGDNSYRIVFFPVAPPDPGDKSDEDRITAYQVQHNEIISSFIRQYPEHWFGWFHRRFRETNMYERPFARH